MRCFLTVTVMVVETVMKAREEMLQCLYMFALEHGATPMPVDALPNKIDDNIRAFNLFYLQEDGYIIRETPASGDGPGYRLTAKGIRLYEELYGKYNL